MMDKLRKYSPFFFSPVIIALQFFRVFSLPVLEFIDGFFSDLSGTETGALKTRYSYIELYNLISRIKKADTAGRGTPFYFAYLALMLLAIAAVVFLYFSFILFLVKNKTAHTYYRIGLSCAVLASVLTIVGALAANYVLTSYFADLGNILLPTYIPAVTACVSALAIILLPQKPPKAAPDSRWK